MKCTLFLAFFLMPVLLLSSKISAEPFQGMTDYTDYIFHPMYERYTAVPGLSVRITKNSPVRCKLTTENSTCMPFDYNSKTIEEIRCNHCKSTVVYNPRTKGEEAMWDPSTCMCQVTKGTIKRSR